MKKDRNSFFSQYGVSAYNTQPYMYPNMNAGMNMNMNQAPAMMNQPMMPAQYDAANDIDARLSKIERELQRLDTRISKLETTPTNQASNTSIANNDYNFANSMYMV